MLAFLLPLLLQITPVAPIVKGTALPPPEADTAAVLAPVERMFAGLAAHDPQAIRAELRPEGAATVAIERPDGTSEIHHLSWDDFTAAIKPGPERLEERFIGAPAVEIDGDIAMVWGRYTFFLDGKPRHCGVNHVDLVRENGQWKVLNITWSQRTTGCEAA